MDGWLATYFRGRADPTPAHGTIALAGTPSPNLLALIFVAQTMRTLGMGGEDNTKDFIPFLSH